MHNHNQPDTKCNGNPITITLLLNSMDWVVSCQLNIVTCPTGNRTIRRQTNSLSVNSRVDQSATWLTASWFVGELSSKRPAYPDISIRDNVVAQVFASLRCHCHSATFYTRDKTSGAFWRLAVGHSRGDRDTTREGCMAAIIMRRFRAVASLAP